MHQKLHWKDRTVRCAIAFYRVDTKLRGGRWLRGTKMN